MGQNSKFFNKNDCFIIAALIISAIIALYIRGQNSGTDAEIYIGGKLYDTIVLNIDRQINIEDKNIIITVKNNEIAFTQSGCPDKICVRTGFIKNPNEYAVCAPNAAYIKIIGNDTQPGTDGITR